MIKQSPPSIRRWLDPIQPVKRTPSPNMVSGPISPLERNPQSPKGWKNRESDGVGLGIVAALGTSDGRKAPEKTAVGTPIKHVSAPVAIGSPRAELGCDWRRSVHFHGPNDGVLFDGSPPMLNGDLRAFRPAEFLRYCHLCRKKLHGKDIYMYRGEKAFCSMECRCQQIASDEFQEKCGSEARRSSEVSCRSPYTGDRLFFMGIVAS